MLGILKKNRSVNLFVNFIYFQMVGNYIKKNDLLFEDFCILFGWFRGKFLGKIVLYRIKVIKVEFLGGKCF